MFMRATVAQVRVTSIALACAFQRLLWVGTGQSGLPLDFQLGNLLCWLDRPVSARSSHSKSGPKNVLMQPSQKTYIAMIWETPTSVGKRVTVVAESLDDALLKFEEEFGKGKVFNLHNEIDASMPR